MYQFFYTLSIRAYGAGIRVASFFNPKARDWIKGRKSIFKKITSALQPDEKIIWFHAASLGEAEQVLPVMQAVRKEFPRFKLLLTFFSPSGMKHFKHRESADYIFYLPLETPRNVQQFLDTVNPSLAFFVKYEVWPNYYLELHQRQIPIIIAPAVFWPEQFYFKKPHRGFFIPLFKKVNAILVQDKASEKLLLKFGVKNVQTVGDSRFDRVLQNTKAPFESAVLKAFAENSPVLVGGSTWQRDEELLKKILEHNPNLKMIIAPHETGEKNVKRLLRLFDKKQSFRYSQPPQNPARYRVCIIDSIGMLSRLYRYGDVAYIGGALGKGIHNSLEAAAYGLPLFFGAKHKNFIEPGEMIQAGFAHEVNSADEMQGELAPLLEDGTDLMNQGEAAKSYVRKNAGVTEKILQALRPLLRN